MYDARDDILALFKQSTYDNDLKTFYYITATDGTNSVNVEICKSEDNALNKNLPLVVLSLADAKSLAADISGNIRQDVCLIDCNIYVNRSGNFDAEALIDDIVDEITSTIWNNQGSITNAFAECIAMRDLTGLEKEPVLRKLIEIRVTKINKKS